MLTQTSNHRSKLPRHQRHCDTQTLLRGSARRILSRNHNANVKFTECRQQFITPRCGKSANARHTCTMLCMRCHAPLQPVPRWLQPRLCAACNSLFHRQQQAKPRHIVWPLAVGATLMTLVGVVAPVIGAPGLALLGVPLALTTAAAASHLQQQHARRRFVALQRRGLPPARLVLPERPADTTAQSTHTTPTWR